MSARQAYAQQWGEEMASRWAGSCRTYLRLGAHWGHRLPWGPGGRTKKQPTVGRLEWASQPVSWSSQHLRTYSFLTVGHHISLTSHPQNASPITTQSPVSRQEEISWQLLKCNMSDLHRSPEAPLEKDSSRIHTESVGWSGREAYNVPNVFILFHYFLKNRDLWESFRHTVSVPVLLLPLSSCFIHSMNLGGKQHPTPTAYSIYVWWNK